VGDLVQVTYNPALTRAESEHEMKTNNVGVINAFMEGTAARSGNMHTDGDQLWSYSTVIGWTVGAVKRVTTVKYSMTTTRHTNMALCAGAVRDD